MILRNSIYAILTLFLSVLVFAYLSLNRPDKYIDEIMFALLLACLFVLYMVVYFLLLRPLGRLARQSSKIAKGDLNQPIIQTAFGEIDEIAKSINLITSNIKQATEFIKKIEKGNIDISTQTLQGNDSLSRALVNMSWQIQKIAEEEQQRNWATEGMAQFVYILRSNNDDIQALCDNIITNLVKYLKVQQGGLFVVNDTTLPIEKRYLELYACYAYDEKKYMHKRIEIGEGLIGQTYIQNETLQLNDIPADYTKVISGLGEASPKHLLIVPMRVNQEVFGLLELASFNPFPSYQIQFIEKLGENIAATISNVKANEKTKQLLEEAQLLAEQLRAQEEEMRQNVEELQSTQEEMARKQQELEATNKKMESNEIVLKKALDKGKNKEQEFIQKLKDKEEEINQLKQELASVKKT
ncbi:GAF domain-containing protein [Thermoflexibacter ruber]|uniref:HAMP domain-containing protein n=1 Tax=Thermoflexibacter ruber TaxID=1003 RepID=A0A1I2BM68_9BACT|nr:GAF domain-containing protein [Thermoflexibacter ruber]SFE57281.1 HAMP domain-containing protein [Thermoflexibacter ruber]